MFDFGRACATNHIGTTKHTQHQGFIIYEQWSCHLLLSFPHFLQCHQLTQLKNSKSNQAWQTYKIQLLYLLQFTPLAPFNPNVNNSAISIVHLYYNLTKEELKWMKVRKPDLMGWKWCIKYLFRTRNFTRSLVAKHKIKCWVLILWEFWVWKVLG